MPKTYKHLLSTWGKYMAGFLVKSIWGCCGSTVLTGASCWPPSNCIPVQKIVSLSTELTHNRSALVLDSNNDVLSPLLFIVYIRVLCTTARGTNPTCEAISPGRKTHFASNEKIIWNFRKYIIFSLYICEKCVDKWAKIHRSRWRRSSILGWYFRMTKDWYTDW